MMVTTEPRPCLSCSKPVKGRTDKKFCDEYCRNNYNNQLKSESNNLVRNINNALSKNRRILESLIGPGDAMAKASRDVLLQKGFRFRYFTHNYTNNKGSTYSFCYDHGYLSLNNDCFLIVKEKEDQAM